MAKEKTPDSGGSPYIIMDASFHEEAGSEDVVIKPGKRPKGRNEFVPIFDDDKATLPEREEMRLRELYDTILVKEFGKSDEHHTSEADPLVKRGRKIPSMCGQMIQFVNAGREYVSVLMELANKQEYMPKEMFIDMVIRGAWQVKWLMKPQMNKALRKKCSFETLLPYIVDSSADLTALEELDEKRTLRRATSKDVDLNDPVALENFRRAIYPPDIYDKLFVTKDWEKVPIYADDNLPEKYTINVLDDKETKKFIKRHPDLVEIVKEQFRQVRQELRSHSLFGNRSLESFYSDGVEDDFELIEEFDRYFGDDSVRAPEFTGHNIIGDENEKALREYFNEVDEYLEEHELYVDDYGRAQNRREVREKEIRDLFDRNGINVRKFINYDVDPAKKKHKVELLPPDPPEPRTKKEKIQRMIFDAFMKNKKKFDKIEKKEIAEAKKRREWNDRHFGGGYVGGDEQYYYDYQGDALDEAIDYLATEKMNDIFGEGKWVDFRHMVEDMSDMSYDHIMGKK